MRSCKEVKKKEGNEKKTVEGKEVITAIIRVSDTPAKRLLRKSFPLLHQKT